MREDLIEENEVYFDSIIMRTDQLIKIEVKFCR